MIREHIIQFFCPADFTDSDTGQTDGTKYFTLTGRDELLDQITIQVHDTPGAAGLKTYTVEATIDGTNWDPVTNEWYGAASFTTHFIRCAAFPTPVVGYRLKRVRSGDAANNDGGTAVAIRQRRWSI